MKSRAVYIVVALSIGAGLAHAGFRHPLEQSGIEAEAVQNTPIHPGVVVVTSSKRVMPDRVMGPAVPPANLFNALPASVKAMPGMKAPVIPQLKSQAKPQIAAKKEAFSPNNPLPKAPALPAAVRFGIPDVQLPHAASGDGLLSMKPEKLSLKGLNRPQIHAFLKHARDLPIPNREFTTQVRSREIAQRYQLALHPVPGRSFRTPYSLSLSKVGKIQQPPAATQYENMVKRIDSLFLGLDLRYPNAVLGLWELAESSTNAREFQARDALFAGLLSSRAGWETTAALFLEESAAKRVEQNDRYLKILWGQLDLVTNPVHLDGVVAAISPLRARDAAPVGDNANYAMAKRLLMKHHRAPAVVYPGFETFLERVSSKNMRDKLTLLAVMAQLRGPSESKRTAAVNTLKAIEAEGNEENRQQARLAIARTLVQHGAPAEALALYKNVQKNGKNRLTVLAEQTFAEYLTGEYQDSLGKSVALQTPYFQYGFAPDVHLVEIMTRKAMCDFGGAEAGVKRFAERYTRELNALEETLSRKAPASAYYEELVGFADSAQPYRYQRYLLQLPSVLENQKAMNQALTELHKLDSLGTHQKIIERPEGWDNFTASLRARWGNRAQSLRAASAETALREAGYLAKRLHHTFAQVELLDLDISTSAAKNYNLQSALNFPARKAAQAKVDDDKLRWPFESEIWEDEIDFMKAKNPSKCAVTAGL